jgi:hypothetical protein
MRLRLASFVMLIALLSAFVVAPLSASAQAAPGGLPVQLTNVPLTASGAPAGTLNGTFTITSFTNQAGQLLANGTVVGTFTNLAGVTTPVNQAVQVPVAAASGSCTILDLTLGPINLNLLGLVVQTNQIHLQITAQQGAGNLLGNLLCAVANLLNPGAAPLGALAGLLNRILAVLP